MGLLLNKQIAHNVSIAVWKITETEDYLLNSLQLWSEDEMRINSINLQTVRLQKLACRAALAKLLGTNKIGITYTENGQPQLQNHHISFSHTKNAVAVALAETPIGIDIEEITPRILPLYARFMNEQERAACDVNNLKNLYYYWCAKEAMYKWFAIKNLDFIEDLQVNKNENKGIICKKHTVNLIDFYIENQIILVCNVVAASRRRGLHKGSGGR